MDYYNQTWEEYLQRSFDLNVDDLYKPFTALVKNGGEILDARCGSGRDVKYLSEKGYQVTAFDYSRKMLQFAHENNPDIDIRHEGFLDIRYDEGFDGVWASASLHHLPYKDMKDAAFRLSRALKPEGIMYCSLKDGQNEMKLGDRYYTLMDEPCFKELIRDTGLDILKISISKDKRPNRETQKWMCVLCKRNLIGL